MKLTENSLRQMIQDIIRELVDENEIDEMSSVTGMAGGDSYQTPYAFTGDSNKNKKLKKLMVRRANPDWTEMWDDDEDPKAERKWSVKLHEEISQEAKDEVTALLKTYNGKEVPDEKIHAIADKYKISPHDLESYIYSLASTHVNEIKLKSLSGAKRQSILYSLDNKRFYQVVGASGQRLDITPVVLDKSGKPDYNVKAGGDNKSIYKDVDKYNYKLFESINEGRRGHYHEFRDDDTMNTRQKIGQSVREINQQLKEIEKKIDMNLRLKQETGIKPTEYWSRTKKSLGRIGERMNRILYKMKQF